MPCESLTPACVRASMQAGRPLHSCVHLLQPCLATLVNPDIGQQAMSNKYGKTVERHRAETKRFFCYACSADLQYWVGFGLTLSYRIHIMGSRHSLRFSFVERRCVLDIRADAQWRRMEERMEEAYGCIRMLDGCI